AGGDRAARSAGRVYMLEAAGAVAAGLILSFALLPNWSALRIAFLGLAVAAAAAGSMRPVRRAGPLALAVLAVVVTALPVSDALDERMLALRWRSLGFVSSRNSVHGRIVATRYGSQESLFENGVLVASAPDRRAAEEAVHMALLQHPAPRRVLLAGGGLGGAVAEILKHGDVESLDYVELDPELVAEAREVHGPAMTDGLDDARVTVHFGDARLFVKAAEGPYDCVIVSAPDPTTLQLNRLYTVGFFSEIAACLADDGVVGLSVNSSENYLSDDLASFLASLRASLGAVYPHVAALPGDPCHMLAGYRPLTRDAETLSSRIRSRGLDTAFVRGYYLRDRLRAERVETFDRSLDEATIELNTDLRPSGYYRSLVLWNRQFSGAPGLLEAGRRFAQLSTAGLLALVMATLALLGRVRSRLRTAVVLSIAVVGATEITLEIAALNAYQSLYGYVYGHVALITAAFMGGLAAGGALGTLLAGTSRPRAYVALSTGIALVPLGLWAAVSGLAQAAPGTLAGGTPVFLLMVVGTALLAGVQFPMAAALLSDRTGSPRGPGRLYAADLAGSALAAPVAAVVLLPVMGIGDAMVAVTLVNCGVVAALLSAVAGRRSTDR
ncbi:MAG: hypothetical protein GF405_10585, partial [Candidatus Eisenbacteria bacterium]|nr:hypothetical protein [Candidatus Eisenbacteria bacterium]